MNETDKPVKPATPQAEPESEGSPAWVAPLKILAWPFIKIWQYFYRHFVSYLIGGVLRDEHRVYSIKFIWYNDSVYWHPMIWGSIILGFLAKAGIFMPGWLLLIWFLALSVCYLSIAYNFNVIRTAMLGVGIVAVLGAAFFSTVRFAWNPLVALSDHVKGLGADVTPGFYFVSAYVFALMIATEVAWAWMFHRVEIDESYVYEHRFLMGTSREPIFARGLKRETKDLLELLILGAADIQHRTKSGYKRFKNVPAASLWLGRAIDSMLDYRRKDQILLEKKRGQDLTDQVRVTDAMPEIIDDIEGEEGYDDGEADQDDDAADDLSG